MAEPHGPARGHAARRDTPPGDSPLGELVAALGIDVDLALLDEAVSHRSWCAENPGNASNERLEFLGDAVLGLVAADNAFRRFPEMTEGELTGVRKGVVNTAALGEIGAELGIGPFIKLGRGEAAGGGARKTTILADTLEAIIGAIYIDRGVATAFEFVERLLGGRIGDVSARLDELDFKSTLQEAAAVRGLPAPVYEITDEGPDHKKLFHALVFVGDDLVGSGDGPSKRAAEQAAAALGVRSLIARDQELAAGADVVADQRRA